jgi:hypothetical protein
MTRAHRHRRFEALPAVAAVLNRRTNFETSRLPATSLARAEMLTRYLVDAESGADG